MERNQKDWEIELWTHLSRGDGVHCPIYSSCEVRSNGGWCFSDHQPDWEYEDVLSNPLDVGLLTNFFKYHSTLARDCHTLGRIFNLVHRLAWKYHEEAGNISLPVPSDLIMRDKDGFPIEVRYLPMRVLHGAIWRLNNFWIIQLNTHDTRFVQRFTLYHEIFHVLSHCEGNPKFRHSSCNRECYFNELLADNFAGAILLPEGSVPQIWSKVKDTSKMAEIFEVPQPLIEIVVRHLGLIENE